MRKIQLSKPVITQECIKEIVSVLESGWLSQGPKVAIFENIIKKKLGMDYALAVNSATAGLHIALLALNIGPGDEVIVPSFTWVATANVVELCGAKPIFVDIDLSTLNGNIEQILSKITEKTKAIIAVHLFGKPLDVDALKTKLPSHIAIIEDAACALGAKLRDKFCGTMGDIAVFSFHPRKSITTGEGGMVVTNNTELYNKMNMLRNHGQDVSYREETPSFMFDCPVVGFNYRMTDLQAVLGTVQLEYLDKLTETRNSLASRYHQKLSGNDAIRLPRMEAHEFHSWQSFVVLVSPHRMRDKIMMKLSSHGIETRPGTHAVHTLKYYKERYRIKPEAFPYTYEAFKASITLPLNNDMTIDDIDFVSNKLLESIYDSQ